MVRKQICEETRYQHPTRPASHLTTLHWPMAQVSPGDTCPAQPEEDAPTSSSLNDGQYLTRTCMDSASPSSPPTPNHSPTQESLEPAEVILSTACTTSPSREHSCAHEAPDPSYEHSYKKRRLLARKKKNK